MPLANPKNPQNANGRYLENPDGSFSQDLIVYTLKTTSLAAGGSAQSTAQINSDSDFFAQKAMFWADVAGTVNAQPLVNIQLVDAASGKQLLTAPTPMYLLAGTGELPWVLPMVRKWDANSQIQMTFTNFSSATTYANIYFAFAGVRRYLA